MDGQPVSFALVVVKRVQKASSLLSESQALCQYSLNAGSLTISERPHFSFSFSQPGKYQASLSAGFMSKV